MLVQTYGFSANFAVIFRANEIRYTNPLIQLAITAVEEAFTALGWNCLASVALKRVSGAAEREKESSLDGLFRTKVDPFFFPGTLSTMRLAPDRIMWDFAEDDAEVTAT